MDSAMEFELTMRLLFGNRAYQIAGSVTHPTYRREWLKKAIKRLTRVVNDLDTTPRHKRMLLSELDATSLILRGIKEPSWDLVCRLLRLAMRLLGFDYVRGAHCHTGYYQTPSQHFTSTLLDGGDALQDHYDRKDAISIRRQVIRDLAAQGFDDFKISLVLNTTEYHVKQLHPKRARQIPAPDTDEKV